MTLFASKNTRDLRYALASIERLDREHALFARDLIEAEGEISRLRARVEELESERERIAPCPK